MRPRSEGRPKVFSVNCQQSSPKHSLSSAEEGLLSFLRAENVPGQTILFYSLSFLLGLALLCIPAILVLLDFVCLQWPKANGSKCWNYLQTLAVFTIVFVFFVLAAISAMTAFSESLRLVLICTSVYVLFAGGTFYFCRCRY